MVYVYYGVLRSVSGLQGFIKIVSSRRTCVTILQGHRRGGKGRHLATLAEVKKENGRARPISFSCYFLRCLRLRTF